MHRSGTSALTRLISLCGAALPRNLLGPVADDNAAGFWESLPLIGLDDEMLSAAERVWHDLRPIPPEWFGQPDNAPLVMKLAAMIRAEFGDARLLAVKDPRVCRLLPLYRVALGLNGVRPAAVIPVRNPLEVAASLHARNGMGEAKAVLLWFDHVMAAERYSRGISRCFTTFEQALVDPAGLLDRVGRELGVVWPRAPAAALPDMAGFLAAELRHQRRDDAAFFEHPDVPDEIKALYRLLIEAAGSGVAPPPAAFDRLTAGLAGGGGLYRAAVAELEAQARRQEADLKHWVDAAVERYDMIEALRGELARRDEAAARRPRWRRLFGA